MLRLKFNHWFLVCLTLMVAGHAHDIITIAQHYISRHNRMIPMKKQSCFDAIFIATIIGCHYDDLLYQQVRQSWHHNKYRFPMFAHHSPESLRFVISTCVTLIGKANCTFHHGWMSPASVWEHKSSLSVIPSTAYPATLPSRVVLWLAGRLSAKLTSPVIK